MISFEDELAEALVQTGAEVTSAPPLRLPAEFQESQPQRLPRLPARWLAPAAAAVAVAGIAVAVSVLAVRPHGTDESMPRETGRATPHPTDQSTPRGTSAAGGIPRYYIAQTGSGRPYSVHSLGAAIFSTATGKLLTRITLPPRQHIIGVTAASDDQTFAVAATRSLRHGRFEQLAFYLLQFSDNRVTIIHAAKNYGFLPLRGLALSPDGTEVAYSYARLPEPTSVLKVLDIYSGKARTWAGPDGFPIVSLGALTWASDSRRLAFNWSGSGFGSWYAAGPGLRLLDTAAPGHLLSRESRLVVPVTASLDESHQPQISVPGGSLIGNILLAPGGTTAVAAVTSMSAAGSGFARFSMRTGRLITTFDTGPTASSDVLWSDPAGQKLIVWSPPGHRDRLAIVRSSKVTLLPASARITFPFAAW